MGIYNNSPFTIKESVVIVYLHLGVNYPTCLIYHTKLHYVEHSIQNPINGGMPALVEVAIIPMRHRMVVCLKTL